MDFISAEEFLKQPKEVQKALLEWYKPQIGDLAIDNCFEIGVVKSEKDIKALNKYKGCENIIPLFTESQLRKFIQDKGYKYIGINNFLELENKGTWRLKVFKSMKQFEPNIEVIGNTALDCYLQAAIEIAEKEAKVNE